ncbi:hypothetical protein IWW38_005529, partial [Coemansia aciculifera]
QHCLIPWLDIAALPTLSTGFSRRRLVAFDSSAAKEHFVSYLSPLTHILLAISNHIEGESRGSGSGNAEESFNWQWLEDLLVVYVRGSSSDSENHSDTIDALLDVYTLSSVTSLRKSIENVAASICLTDSKAALSFLERVFSVRPLGISTLHELRPKVLSHMPPVTDTPEDTKSAFRPSYELFPLAAQVLKLALHDGSEDKVAEAVDIISVCFRAMARHLNTRRPTISLNPRLKSRGKLEAPLTDLSDSAIKGLASAKAFKPDEAPASANAHALERSTYLLTLLLLNHGGINGAKHFVKSLASSSIILKSAVALVKPEMALFSTVPVTLKLLNLLWAAVDDGEAMVGDVRAEHIWSKVDFKHLAKRISDDSPDMHMTWPYVKATYIEH